jgi:hypothetical protein
MKQKSQAKPLSNGEESSNTSRFGCYVSRTAGWQKQPCHLAWQESRTNTIAPLQNSQFVTPTRDNLSAPWLSHSDMRRVHLALTAGLYNARH